jgi:hypothetical protein
MAAKAVVSKPALVPGSMPEQFATKSERQAERTAARCSSVLGREYAGNAD